MKILILREGENRYVTFEVIPYFDQQSQKAERRI